MTNIYFNHQIKNSLEMLNLLKSEIPDITEINDSCMEATWDFMYQGLDFYIQFDENSISNSLLPNYQVTSFAADEGNEDEISKNTTKELYKLLQRINGIEKLDFSDY